MQEHCGGLALLRAFVNLDAALLVKACRLQSSPRRATRAFFFKGEIQMENTKTTTAADRANIVQQANANSALEGLEPDAADKARHARYVSGELTSADLVKEVMAEAQLLKAASLGKQ
jgi:hypothetical protein